MSFVIATLSRLAEEEMGVLLFLPLLLVGGGGGWR